MKDAPEGLSYGHDNDKYARADKTARELVNGKILMGEEHLQHECSALHKGAAELRAQGCGSVDPYWGKGK